MANQSRANSGAAHAKLIVAIVTAAVGTVVIFRGVSRFAPSDRRGFDAPSVPSTTITPDSEPFVLARRLETADTDAVALRPQIEQALRDAFGQAPVQPAIKDQLAESSAAVLAAVAAADYDAYWTFFQAHGGVSLLDLSVPANAEGDRGFFASKSAPYRGRPIGLDRITIRPRVLRGQNVPQDDFGASRGNLYAYVRYPALSRVARRTEYGHVIESDTYEVLVPIEHEYEGEVTPILLGLWFTRAPENGRWTPSQLVTYSPRDHRGAIISPPF